MSRVIDLGHKAMLGSRGLAVAGLLVLAAAPLLSQVLPVSIPLVCEILVFGLYAMAYNLTLGHTGIISLGHAAFFGVGAYVTGISLKYFGLPLELALLVAVLAAALAGMLMATLALKTSGPYLLIITLATSMVFYYVAQVWVSLTGGHDGMTGIPGLKLFFRVALTNQMNAKYYFILTVFAICIFLMWRLVNSPLGKAMTAVRENQQRAQSCGYNTYWVQWWAFVASALFSGVAGGLFLVFLEFCDVLILYWLMSGTALVITLFGGSRVFLGPFVGALVFIFMRNSLSLYIQHWEVFTGFFFVAIVLFLPKGIAGSIMELVQPKKGNPSEDVKAC
jgi:branched-chain amino acid transport system permease protein